MNVLFASSELFPFSKTGGLADMVAALSKALAADGHSVSVITPLYRGIRDKHKGIDQTDIPLSLPLGSEMVAGKVWSTQPADGSP